MKLEVFNQESNKLWNSIAGEYTTDLLHFDLESYKELLVFFQIGESCYFIFNFQSLAFDFASKEVEALLGYDAAEVTTALLLECIHPEDRAWFLSCQSCTLDFITGLLPSQKMKYKLRFDCRFRKKSGDYLRLMQQVVIVHTDDHGGILRTLIVLTDISHLKKHGKPVLSFIGMDGETSFLDVDVSKSISTKDEILSKREKEVLYYLVEGKVSKEIADLLNISKETVDRHRKNMLHKNKLGTTGELIGKAIREGWI